MPGHLAAIGLAAFFLLTGCTQQVASPVDPDLAKSSLIETLEAWKNGGTIQQLRERDPEIVAQDPAWSQGQTLLSYRLIDGGREEDANLYCEVELTLRHKEKDQPQTKVVTYVIGTSPVITVFRAIL